MDVTFTCVTRGSDAIAWTSDVYIGAGGVQLGFVADLSNPGDRRTSVSNTDTVAMLTREYDDQGIMVLESELRITPLPDPQTATVACIHVVNGERKIANFQVIGKSFLNKDSCKYTRILCYEKRIQCICMQIVI